MTRPILDLGSWCILRCSSADTLRVVQSLRGAGLEVWTPVEKRIGRMPKTRARFDKPAALMPSYVFGRVEHVDELLRLAVTPGREHPRFTVFRYQGGIPLIADDQLDALRGEQDRRMRVFEKWKRKGWKGAPLTPGMGVKLPEGPFEGYFGIVEGTEGQFTLVDIDVFGKSRTIKVQSLLLSGNVAEGELPHARAA